MPRDLPNNQHPLSRRRAVAVIERAEQDALRQLREAGVPAARALAAMERITVFGLQTLRALDALYQQFDDIVAEAGRDEAHQQWFNNKATALLLQVESAFATLVAETIHSTVHEPDPTPESPWEVISVPAKPTPSPWQRFLRQAPLQLVWVVGIMVWSLGALQATGGAGLLTVLAFVFALVLWLSIGSYWWSILFPLAAVGVPVFIFLL
jgi:hypothetical protein